MPFSIDDLRHRTVLDAAGAVIGEVDALFFNSATWRIDTVRVALRRDVTEQAGVSASLFRKAHIDVPTELVQSVGDGVILAVSLDQLRERLHLAEDEDVRGTARG